ncbi:MAG TPA: glycine cleavage system protein GcvH [Thermoanaerobaculia bacterium]|jgi:glycine cleavage system H protein|nr:glycine cleavage system protein GcvH [Thermoanaerobaculia bacterium]
MKFPDDLHYSKSHEWVRIDGAIATVGITEHAQKELGEIVYLELPEVGHVFDSGQEFGTVESVKAVSELFTPIAGEVTEVNTQAVEDPAAVNEDSYGDGWLVKLKLSTDDVSDLMDSAAYEKYVKEESEEH